MTGHVRRCIWTSSVVVLLALYPQAGPGRADIISKAKKGVTSEAHKADHDVSKTEKTVEKGGATAEKTAGKEASSLEHKAVGETKHVFSSGEIDSLSSSANRSFAKELKEGEAEYRKAVDEAKKLYTEAEEAALRSAAGRFLERYSGFLGKLHARMEVVEASDDAMEIVKRLVKSAADRKWDVHTADDVQQIGELLGLVEGVPDAIVPGESGGLVKSSWGMAVGVRGLAQVEAAQVGGEGALGFIAACQQEKSKPLEYSFFLQPGLTLGVGAGQTVSGGVIFFWQPGSPSEAQALWAGLTASISAQGSGNAKEPQKYEDIIAVRRDAKTGKILRDAPTAKYPKGRLKYWNGTGQTSAGSVAGGVALTVASASGVGLGLNIGVRWKVLSDPLKGHVAWPKGSSAAIPGFYLEPIASARSGFNAGVEVSQMFVDTKLLNAAKEAGQGGPH